MESSGLGLRLKRTFNDWEVLRLIECYKFLETFQGFRNGEDCLWWKGHCIGVYKVRDGYKILNQIEPWIGHGSIVGRLECLIK